MGTCSRIGWKGLAPRIAVAVAAALLIADASPARANEFDDELARVDEALRKNPGQVQPFLLDACLSRRNIAIKLYKIGEHARARRRLAFCEKTLKIPVAEQKVADVNRPSPEEVQAQAALEVERALELEPDLANGLEIYRSCSSCHMPEGSGLAGGSVPQIAGQHRKVVIKQLADIRAGNRDNLLMVPYSSVESIGGAQAVADVAGYIDTLEIAVDTSKGPGDDLEYGKQVYEENCTSCHGAMGQGDNDDFVPRIQAQHYPYLVRQFEWIRDGKRRNANAEMAEQIEGFDERATHAVLDYVSRLEPPEEFQAPPGWSNPDFEN